MLNKATQVLDNFLAQLHTYDYYAFIWITLIFVLLLILSIVMTKKSPPKAVLIMLSAFVILLAGPFISFHLIHNFVYKTELNVDLIKKLHYSKSLVVKGTLRNKGIEDFGNCVIKADVFKTNQNSLKDFVSKLKPMKNKTIFIDKKIVPGEIHIFNFIIEPYEYRGDFNVSLEASCTK